MMGEYPPLTMLEIQQIAEQRGLSDPYGPWVPPAEELSGGPVSYDGHRAGL